MTVCTQCGVCTISIIIQVLCLSDRECTLYFFPQNAAKDNKEGKSFPRSRGHMTRTLGNNEVDLVNYKGIIRVHVYFCMHAV